MSKDILRIAAILAIATALSILPFQSIPSPSTAGWSAGILAGDWAQSSEADFSAGAFHQVRLAPLGDGALQLSPTAARGVFTSTISMAPFPFNALGACWRARVEPGTYLTVALRTRGPDGSWSDWRDIPEVDQGPDGRFCAANPLSAKGGREMQYRLTFAASRRGPRPILEQITLTYINATSGPTADEARQAVRPLGGVAPLDIPKPWVIPRAAWGADESLRFDDWGWEIWPPEYAPVEKIIIHHTATDNDDQDPAIWVRSIYYYHAVTRGWGDIGYNYLVDRFGNIYEGRYGGLDVVGGHALNYNYSSMGISAIGTYGNAPGSIVPPASLLEGLASMAAWECARSLIHPQGHSFFVETDLPNIAGHRECLVDGRSRTDCPGDYLFAELPGLRGTVWARLQDGLPTYDARFLHHTTPLSMIEGHTYVASLTLQNGGTLTWSAEGEAPVHLGYHWYDETGQQVVQPPEEDHRTALEEDIPFGDETTLSSALVTAPHEPGTYRLEWDLVQEGVTWFLWQGSTPLELTVQVSAEAAPTPIPTPTPLEPTTTPTPTLTPTPTHPALTATSTPTRYPWRVYLPLYLREDRAASLTPTPAPSSTPGVTATPNPGGTPTAAAPVCDEGVANGGFEYDGDWEISADGGYATAVRHGGVRSMRIGITDLDDNRYSYSSTWQWVTIPANAVSAALRFWLYPLVEEPSDPDIEEASGTDDAQLVLIFDKDGGQSTLVHQRSNDRQWIFYEHDLVRYAGQTVKLYFGVRNDGQGGVTAVYVDDVSLEVCSEGPGP